MTEQLKEFKPALLFVTKFLVIYFIGNIIYGVYVESFNNMADPVTTWVTNQTNYFLNGLGEGSEILTDNAQPKVHIFNGSDKVLSVYEGCNGLNVMIIFVAFLVAYGGNLRNLMWFIPLGLVLIHFANIVRIVLLYFVAYYRPNFMYFTHKFLFTGFIYAFVLVLWYWWVTRLSQQLKVK